MDLTFVTCASADRRRIPNKLGADTPYRLPAIPCHRRFGPSHLISTCSDQAEPGLQAKFAGISRRIEAPSRRIVDTRLCHRFAAGLDLRERRRQIPAYGAPPGFPAPPFA